MQKRGTEREQGDNLINRQILHQDAMILLEHSIRLYKEEQSRLMHASLSIVDHFIG